MTQGRKSQRYLSGRSKIIGFSGLSTDRHLYVEPGQVEPNLGFPGEKKFTSIRNLLQINYSILCNQLCGGWTIIRFRTINTYTIITYLGSAAISYGLTSGNIEKRVILIT